MACRSVENSRQENLLQTYKHFTHAKNDIANLIELPQRAKLDTPKWHIESIELLRRRIGLNKSESRKKVVSINEYVEIMEKLDEKISFVMNSKEGSGDNTGIIRDLARATKEFSYKQAFISELEQESQKIIAAIERTKQEMRKMISAAKQNDAIETQQRQINIFVKSQSESKQIR